jgi:NAD(P)-dependent dehydrogenase (short-subunit alcohol dehydrogenase family)
MKLALVTGSCRRLGAEIAGRLAEEGYALALHGAHDIEPDARLAERIAGAGVAAQLFVADLADPAAVAALPARVADHFGVPPGLLVNNASRFADDDAVTATVAGLDAHLAVNAVAPFALSLALAKGASAAAPLTIVNILDERIVNPPRDQLSYTLSKQLLAEMTRTLARALAPHTRVCGVAPGLTLPTADYAPGQVERLAQLMPLRRLSRPQDIAEAVAYLARADATTGQLLFVDGGASMTAFDRDFVHLARDG